MQDRAGRFAFESALSVQDTNTTAADHSTTAAGNTTAADPRADHRFARFVLQFMESIMLFLSIPPSTKAIGNLRRLSGSSKTIQDSGMIISDDRTVLVSLDLQQFLIALYLVLCQSTKFLLDQILSSTSLTE